MLQLEGPVMAKKLQIRNLGKKQQTDSNSKSQSAPSTAEASNGASKPAAVSQTQKAIESGIASGFQLACAAGPLCQAPLWGVAFELAVGVAVADFDFSEESWRGLNLLEGSLGPISGQVRSLIFLKQGYTCSV